MSIRPGLSAEENWRAAAFALLYRAVTVFVLIAVAPLTAVSDPVPFPLETPDTSSPRATLECFMSNASKGTEAYRAGKDAAEILPWFRRSEYCLDLSHVSPDRRVTAATEAGLLLYEVINRAGIPEHNDIPDAAEVEEKGIESWVVPRTRIVINRIEEGERKGEYLFSFKSVYDALKYYEQVKHLPHNSRYSEGSYEEYVTRPDFSVPYLWADNLPAWANERMLRNPVWKYIALLLTLGAGVLLALIMRRLGRAWDKKYEHLGGDWGIGTLVFSVSLVLIPLLIGFILEDIVGVRFGVRALISKLLLITAFVAAVFALVAFIDFIANLLVSNKRLQEKTVDAQFVRVSARIIGIVAGVFVFVAAVEYLGYQLTPVLAGLGIGGLAVALAARPTLENMIGGFTLFADRPVKVGDYCRFGEQEGTVVDIGLRSTRLRLRDDTLVSVPNASFAQMELHNQSERRQRLYRPIIGLRYETTTEQLRYVLAKLREMLIAHPEVAVDPMFVRFMGFGAYSLDIEMFANTKANNWLEYRAIREDINFRIMDIVKEAGTGFAFPSQTNYFTRDGGLDAEQQREAEQQVEFWRSRDKLPFPEFESEDQQQTEDTLDYPPKGSPDYIQRNSFGKSDNDHKAE